MKNLVSCGFSVHGIEALVASASHLPELIPVDRFCEWLGTHGVEPSAAREYARILLEGRETEVDPRLFVVQIVLLSTEATHPVPTKKAHLLFDLYCSKDHTLHHNAVLFLLGQVMDTSTERAATALSAQSDQHTTNTNTNMTRDEFARMLGVFCRATSPMLDATSEAVSIHANCRPQLVVNGHPVAPSVTLATATKASVFRFVVKGTDGPLSSIRFQLGSELARRASVMGLTETRLRVEQDQMDPQTHTLVASARFRLNWDLHPPFTLAGTMTFIFESFDAVHWGPSSSLLGNELRTCSGGGRASPTCSGGGGGGGGGGGSNNSNTPPNISRVPTIPDPSLSPWSISSHTMTVERRTGLPLRMEPLSSASLSRASTDGSAERLKRMHKCAHASGRISTQTARALTMLEEFANNHFSWDTPSLPSEVADLIVLLADRAAGVFATEPRLVRVDAPAYVMGDLHGNFEDLKVFEQSFWRHGPTMSPANLVFLGDYVDRRDFSVEVILYLFAQKLEAPSKVTLLRGNHEMAQMNVTHGFQKECLTKFGPVEGMRVWNACNNAFNYMPISAVIGQTIFCGHGGIPSAEDAGAGVLDRINQIPYPLVNPDEHPLARDLLWADPMEQEDGVNDYLPNTDRQISHFFSSRALQSFLRENGLQFVLRAHQFKRELGFQIQKHAQLITVFSSSAYCQLNNEAACLLVSDGKIRTIRIDATASRM